MPATYKTVIISRLIAVITAGLLLIGGATFAALQTQSATSRGNRITSATANLLIGDTQGGFGTETGGFDFSNVEPGGAAMPTPGHKLFLKNDGTSNLTLRLAANPNTIRNPQIVNFNKVYVVMTPMNGPDAGQTQQVSLQSILAAYDAIPVSLKTRGPANQTVQYSLQVQMAADAVGSTSSGATIEGLDLAFSGTTASN